MANPIKGEVPFIADGTSYIMVYSINALCALEDKLDMAIDELGARMSGNIRMSMLRTVFWAGLIEHHNLDEDEAGRLIAVLDGGVGSAGELIARAFALAFPSPEKDPGTRPRKAAGKTG